MVLGLFLILFNTAGMGFYVFPVFISSLQAEFGWSMTQISTGVAIFAIVMGLSGPAIGLLIGRFGVRRTMLAAAMLAGLCNLGYAAMQSLWMLYLLMTVSGFAIAGITVLPAQTAVTNWFDRYRGRAMALAFLGPGAGGFLLPPFNEFLIRFWGWRFTWVFATVVLWLLVVPLMAGLVRTKPSEMGLRPDGTAPGEGAGEETTAALTGLPVRRALASQTFWLLISIFLLQVTGLSALNFHFVPFAEQQAGFTSQQAAFFYGLALGFSLGGRLLAGWLADRVKPNLVMVLTGFLMACGPATLELFIVRLGLRNVDLLWLYAVPYGIGFGANAIIVPILVGRCFGELNFAKISGIIGLGFAIGVVVGIPLAGNIFDRTGSYEIVIVFAVVGCLTSAVLALFIRPDRHHSEFMREGAGGQSPARIQAVSTRTDSRAAVP
jgi:predicted MFS family arabinose efflux permease